MVYLQRVYLQMVSDIVWEHGKENKKWKKDGEKKTFFQLLTLFSFVTFFILGFRLFYSAPNKQPNNKILKSFNSTFTSCNKQKVVKQPVHSFSLCSLFKQKGQLGWVWFRLWNMKFGGAHRTVRPPYCILLFSPYRIRGRNRQPEIRRSVTPSEPKWYSRPGSWHRTWVCLVP